MIFAFSGAGTTWFYQDVNQYDNTLVHPMKDVPVRMEPLKGLTIVCEYRLFL